MVQAVFIYVGYIYVRGADGDYTTALDEAKIRGAAEFREVWDMDYAVEKLSADRPSGVVS
jgi:hypothetical protein